MLAQVGTEVAVDPAPPRSPEEVAEAAFARGLDDLRSGDRAAAISCWKKAAELFPDNRRYRVNLQKLLGESAADAAPDAD